MEPFEVFGSLTAIRQLGINKRGEYLWEFRCKCGKTHIAVGTVIKRQDKIVSNPEVPSCGCIGLKVSYEQALKHGYVYHPLYNVYKGIHSRCYNKNNISYPLYGGAGVTVCAEWFKNPGEFITWSLNNGWKSGLQLDKDILCDKLKIYPKIYSPLTCQFISMTKNSVYASSRETAKKGSKNIIVSTATAVEIKNMYANQKVSQRNLATKFGVSQNTICRIVNT